MTDKMTVENIVFIMKKDKKATLSDGFACSFLSLEKSTKNHETIENTDGTNDAFNDNIWTIDKGGENSVKS